MCVRDKDCQCLRAFQLVGSSLQGVRIGRFRRWSSSVVVVVYGVVRMTSRATLYPERASYYSLDGTVDSTAGVPSANRLTGNRGLDSLHA